MINNKNEKENITYILIYNVSQGDYMLSLEQNPKK